MKQASIEKIELHLDRVVIYDYYDGITDCLAYDGALTIYRLQHKQKIDVFEDVNDFLYLYDAKTMDTNGWLGSFHQYTSPGTFLRLRPNDGLVGIFEPFFMAPVTYVEHWLAFGIDLGSQVVYPLRNR